MNNIQIYVDEFIHKLRLEKFDSEQVKAEESLAVLEYIVAEGKWNTARDLLSLLQNVEAEVQAKMPWETTPCNMVHRVIKVVRDEYNSGHSGVDGVAMTCQSISHEMLNASVSEELPDMTEVLPGLRDNILEVLTEHKAEVEQCIELIALQGESKIHSDEVIMTCDYCPTVLSFLTRAAKKRQFQVIVAESAPKYDGHKMAKLLSSANIQTMLIQDCAIFSLMSRVNKVIIGTQTVFSNGGIKTFVGATVLAIAAKFYSVPFYVCCPTYKFSLSTSEEVNHYGTPNSIITSGINSLPSNVQVAIAKFDYVPPENISSFITNNRGISPSYVYRQLTELYHPTSSDL